jgi:hypothetical protein
MFSVAVVNGDRHGAIAATFYPQRPNSATIAVGLAWIAREMEAVGVSMTDGITVHADDSAAEAQAVRTAFGAGTCRRVILRVSRVRTSVMLRVCGCVCRCKHSAVWMACRVSRSVREGSATGSRKQKCKRAGSRQSEQDRLEYNPSLRGNRRGSVGEGGGVLPSAARPVWITGLSPAPCSGRV